MSRKGYKLKSIDFNSFAFCILTLRCFQKLWFPHTILQEILNDLRDFLRKFCHYLRQNLTTSLYPKHNINI